MRIQEGISSIIKTAKDTIFPVFCLGCEREGEWVCSKCRETLLGEPILCCPVCHAQTDGGGVCECCTEDSVLLSHVAIIQYKEAGLIGKMVHDFKYNYAEELAEIFEYMTDAFLSKHTHLFSHIELVVPVPLHKKRYAERGFNQAEVFSSLLARKLGIPSKTILRRTQHTLHQARLERKERFQNVKRAFQSDAIEHQKNILLVDDVYTTGATMQSCAKALQEAGSGDIFGCSIARG